LSPYCYYSDPVKRVRSIAISLSVCESVCLSVCPRAYPWNRSIDLHDFLWRSPVAVASSVLLRRRCDTGAESDIYECLVIIIIINIIIIVIIILILLFIHIG